MKDMTRSAAASWPCIVSRSQKGGSAQYCSQVVESLAAFRGQKLFKVKAGAFLDAGDLLGGYIQHGLQIDFEFFTRRLILAFLPSDSPHISVQDKLVNIQKLISN